MSQSYATRLMLADNAAISTNALAVAFNECSLAGQRVVGTHMGHRGTRQRASCRARNLSDMSAGSVSGNFSVQEIDWFIPRSLQNPITASPWIPTDSISEYYAIVDKVAAMYLYNKLRTTSFEVSGSQAQYLNWTFNMAGELEDSFAGPWPASPLIECGTAFTLSDCTFTYNGTPYKMAGFRLLVDNAVDTQQFENALTPTRFETQDLIVQLSLQCAFRSDTVALYDAAVAGATASLAITNGVTTYTFHFANLKYRSGVPTIPGQGRVAMPLTFEAFRSDSTGVLATDNQLRIVKA